MNIAIKKNKPPVTDKTSAVDWASIDTQFEFIGKKIVLPGDPENMPYDVAIEHIIRQKEAENQRYDVNEIVTGAPWDALVALSKAMKDIYGVVIAQSIYTFFGEIKPDLLTIKTGPKPNDNIQVAMGKMSLPNIEEPVMIQLIPQGAMIMGSVKRKDRAILVEIANRAREIMRTDSIYRGKAISLQVDDDGDLMLNQQPHFISDLEHVKETDIIHTELTQKQIDTTIFAPIKHTEACRKYKIPLKNGVLLHGRYGTGKSLTAKVTAKVAVDNGWTFVMLSKSQGLASAIEFAKTYQPCVIFAEDIDRAAEDRDDEAVNDLINMLDGLLTKDMEIQVVLTTNFINKIDTALLRPGRFDSVIEIDPPDADTVLRLIYHYSCDLIPDYENLTRPIQQNGHDYTIGELLAGQIPATIREVVERAKKTMIMQDRQSLTTSDLVVSAYGMKKHMALLEPKVEVLTPAEKFYNAFKEMITEAANIDTDVVESLIASMTKVRNDQKTLAKFVSEKLDKTNAFSQAAAGAATSAKDAALSAVSLTRDDLDTTKKVLKAVTD